MPLYAMPSDVPRQALPLPPAVLHLPHAATSDLFLRNLGGSPNEDPPQTQRFLLCLTVGLKQKTTVDTLVQKVKELGLLVALFSTTDVLACASSTCACSPSCCATTTAA